MMSVSTQLRRTSWTLLDQGVVSLGMFVLNVVLARTLAPADYGTFALLLGMLFTIQIVNGSLIFYPLSVRCAVLPASERPGIIGCSLVIVAISCALLSLLIAGVLLLTGLHDLMLPLLAFFPVWQMQEALRRGLFSEFRHRDALIGDTIGYFGQAAAILFLVHRGPVSLSEVFYCMAIASAVALAVNYLQVRASFRDLRRIRSIFADYWSIGAWSLANNLTSVSRSQICLWGLSFLYGAAATGALQAALNVINLANPILIGLCNVIPQTAAQKFRDGYGSAWLATRPYALAGAFPVMLSYGILLVAPELVLSILYGSNSAYVDQVVPIRILAVGWLLGYMAEMICSYMHGVDSARLALLINAAGAIAVAILFVPLTISYGVIGSCIALTLSSLVRLVAAQWMLSRMISHERRPAV